jgi:dolichyl-phosphate beta-glucosyltransferase
MAADPSVSLILPAYNEAQTIRHTLEEATAYLSDRALEYEVLVVAEGDDGTGDIVAELAASNPRLRVLGGRERRGKGHAIRAAVAVAQMEVIGFADADNKTPICELDRVLPWLGKYDLVIGSRAQPDSVVEKRQKWYRQIGSRGFWVLMQLVVGLPGIRDTQCGFKFFDGDVARDLFGRQQIDGYMFDVEVLYLASQSGYRIKEVGVRWRDDGDSRLQLIQGNVRNVMDILGIRFGKKRPAVAVVHSGRERQRVA